MNNVIKKKWKDYVSMKFVEADIVITAEEKASIEIVDFGLNNFEKIGLSILIYVNTKRVCAKEMYLLPNQVCPEHRHPNINGKSGKEETFRCRRGKVYLYVPSKKSSQESVTVETQVESVFTVFKEIILDEGEQYTIYPDSLHWFKGGSEGAIVSEFSTYSTDAHDIFSDPKIIRI